MNDRAREVLIDAALKGQKQIKGQLHDGKGGVCAMGALHLTLHDGDHLAAHACYRKGSPDCWFSAVWQAFDLAGEVAEIEIANDLHGWDFLTIARKIGVESGA